MAFVKIVKNSSYYMRF